MGIVLAYWIDYASIRSLSGGVRRQFRGNALHRYSLHPGRLALPRRIPDGVRIRHVGNPAFSTGYTEVGYQPSPSVQLLIRLDGCTLMEKKKKR